MNPDKPSREEIEAKLTALLLGELPEEEARLLRWAIEHDAGLAKLYEQLKRTIGIVREVSVKPAESDSAESAALKLSGERREKLLAHFKTPRPKVRELFWLKRIEMPSLIPVLVALALIAVLAAMLLPALARAKSKAQSTSIVNNLKQLDLAKNVWAEENHKPGDAVATMDDLKPYLSKDFPQSIAGEKYDVGRVSGPVTADIDAGHAKLLGSLAKKLPSGGAGGEVVQYSSDGKLTVLSEAERQKQLQLAENNQVRFGFDLNTPADSAERGAIALNTTPNALPGGGPVMPRRTQMQATQPLPVVASPPPTVSPPVVAQNRLGLDLAGGTTTEIVLPKTEPPPEFAFNGGAAVPSAQLAVTASAAPVMPESPAPAAVNSGDGWVGAVHQALPQAPAEPSVALSPGGVVEGFVDTSANWNLGVQSPDSSGNTVTVVRNNGNIQNQVAIAYDTPNLPPTTGIAGVVNLPGTAGGSGAGGGRGGAGRAGGRGGRGGGGGRGAGVGGASGGGGFGGGGFGGGGGGGGFGGGGGGASAGGASAGDGVAASTPGPLINPTTGLPEAAPAAGSDYAGAYGPQATIAGYAGNISGSATLAVADQAREVLNKRVDQFGIAEPVIGANPGDTSVALNDSGADRSRTENQANGYGNQSSYSQLSGPVQVVDPQTGLLVPEFNVVAGTTSINGTEVPVIKHVVGTANPMGQFPGNTAAATGSRVAGDSFDTDDSIAAAQNQAADQAGFYRGQAGEVAAEKEKVPVLGDMLMAGDMFDKRRSSATAPTTAPASSGALDQTFNPGAPGNSAEIAEGYRRNTTVQYYSYDSNFVSNFGANSDIKGFFDDSYSTGNGTKNIGEEYRQLTKSGGGAVAMNGANTYSGGTVVNNGTLTITNQGTIQSYRDQEVYVAKLNNADPNQAAQVLRNMFANNYARENNQNGAIQTRNGGGGGGSGGNGALVATQISVDPVTHNLVVVTDKETEAQINKVLASLDNPPSPTLSQQQLQLPAKQQEEDRVAPKPASPPLVPQPNLDDYELIAQTPHKLDPEPIWVRKSDHTPVSPEVATILNIERKMKKPETTTEMTNVEKQANSHMEQADQPLPKPPANAPIPQPEILTSTNAFSTFSMNVSDVSFKLAEASLQKGKMPDAASIRSEEFINAFDYRDPEAAAGQPVAFASERARYPFAQNRDLLRFSIKTAAAGRAAGRPLNLVLLLDTSGSMERADRVAIIREAMRVLAAQLHPQDTVSVVTFARTARLWADGVSGDKAGETLDRVGGITPEGGTNLEEAMNLAYQTALRHYLANGANRVVLLTDGAANLGNVDPGALKQKVESFRKQGIALDCFGIGWEDYDDTMLAELSGNGDGRYAFINTPEEAGTEFAAKLAGALQVAAQDVKVQVEFNPQRVTSWRQIGYAKHQLTKEQFRDNSVLAAEVAAQEAGNALYTVEIKPDGIGPVATVYVRYKIPGTMDVEEHSWAVPYDGNVPALEQSSPAMRLAGTASAFSEWLAASPFAQEVTTDELLRDLSGVPQIYGADQRPRQLEMMIREAKSLSGK